MSSSVLTDTASSTTTGTPTGRLYVAWRDPVSRAMVPIARLDRSDTDGTTTYEYRYLRAAAASDRFRALVGFPDLRRAYRSNDLFPFFENRLMARTRIDYSSYLDALGLAVDADPFEVLARSEGRRETDTFEVFPEPTLSGGVARCRFLVHGVRHVPGASAAIEMLTVGDQLAVLPDPQNPADAQAVLLRDGDFHLLGWVPRYLTELVHTPLKRLGPDGIEVQVEHVGNPDGPVHLRLLCALAARWPADCAPPFRGPDFEPVATR